MNFRNKYLSTTIRTLFGLFMLFSGVSGLYMFYTGSMEGVPEAILPTFTEFKNSGILYMIKITETVAGLMLVINFLPALAAIFLAPIAIGIIVFNAMLSPEFVPMGVVVALLDIYLGYLYWDKYKALFRR